MKLPDDVISLLSFTPSSALLFEEFKPRSITSLTLVFSVLFFLPFIPNLHLSGLYLLVFLLPAATLFALSLLLVYWYKMFRIKLHLASVFTLSMLSFLVVSLMVPLMLMGLIFDRELLAYLASLPALYCTVAFLSSISRMSGARPVVSLLGITVSIVLLGYLLVSLNNFLFIIDSNSIFSAANIYIPPLLS